MARTRKRGFCREVVEKFQRRAEEVTLLIREAFLRGISTRQVGRVVATLTGETVSRADGVAHHPLAGRNGASSFIRRG